MSPPRYGPLVPSPGGRLGAEDLAMRADLVVGSRLPDLELPDHRRRPVRLSALANGYPLLVSFYRGYW
jgi:hypothetical protein